jgi:hypothetical protein
MHDISPKKEKTGTKVTLKRVIPRIPQKYEK